MRDNLIAEPTPHLKIKEEWKTRGNQRGYPLRLMENNIFLKNYSLPQV
jgi:hypothetical protein